MQTTKATSSPEHRTSSAPAAKPAQGSLPASSSQPSSVLTSRPELASLFPSSVDAQDASRLKHAAQTSSPGFKPAVIVASDARKTQGDDAKGASAVNAGIKRARDGKDGPEAKPSGTEQSNQKTASGKPRPRAAEAADNEEAESTLQNSTKRARKGSKSVKRSMSVKSDKTPRPRPADDSASQTEAHSPRPKIIPTLTPSNQAVTPDADPGSPTSWKHGAQSPRASAASRASITLAPKRNSNASAMERPSSPAPQAEKPPADKPVALDTASAKPILPKDDFAFSACDSDTEGVIRVVSSAAEQGKEGQTAPVPGLPDTSVPTHRQSSTPPVRQDVPGGSALPAEMTALMDELDAALEKPIDM